MEQRSSACPLDCPDACGLTVSIDAGRVVGLEGDHRGPITDGFICGKVRKFTDHMYGHDRIARPLVRAGAKGSGEWHGISWEEALGLMADRLQAIKARSGGEAILPYHYGGSNGWLTDGALVTRFFRRLGASNLQRTFCASATGAATRGLYGVMPGTALEDFVHAKLIVLWGVNPSATGIHLVPMIERAREAGAKLVVIDPRRTPSRGARICTSPHARAPISPWRSRSSTPCSSAVTPIARSSPSTPPAPRSSRVAPRGGRSTLPPRSPASLPRTSPSSSSSTPPPRLR